MTNHSQQNFNGKYFTFLVFFSCKIQYFGPKIVKNYQFTWFCSQRSIFKSKLSPKKERSIRKYGKSPNEVSFFERSITGHPAVICLTKYVNCVARAVQCRQYSFFTPNMVTIIDLTTFKSSPVTWAFLRTVSLMILLQRTLLHYI